MYPWVRIEISIRITIVKASYPIIVFRLITVCRIEINLSQNLYLDSRIVTII